MLSKTIQLVKQVNLVYRVYTVSVSISCPMKQVPQYKQNAWEIPSQKESQANNRHN